MKMKCAVKPVLLCFSAIALSCTSAAEDLGEVLQRSEIIAVVNITAGTIRPREEIDNGCGYAYEAYVGTSIKNSREGERLSFRANLPLSLSGTYLVFLTDTVVNDLEGSMSRRARISSARCAASGVTLTPLEFLRGNSMIGGPEIILERWSLQARTSTSGNRSVEHFVGSQRLKGLFEDGRPDNAKALAPTIIDVQQPSIRTEKLAYNAASLLSLLQRVK